MYLVAFATTGRRRKYVYKQSYAFFPADFDLSSAAVRRWHLAGACPDRKESCLVRATRTRDCRLTKTSVKPRARRKHVPFNRAWLDGTTTRRSANPWCNAGTRVVTLLDSAHGKQAESHRVRNRDQNSIELSRDSYPYTRYQSICGQGHIVGSYGPVQTRAARAQQQWYPSMRSSSSVQCL